ncbi:MAG: methyltransferase domain-containing protein [bacterium]
MIKKNKSSLKNRQQKAWLKSIGPVENLESYVKADWWREIFNANYLRTDGDVVGDAKITKDEIDLFIDFVSPAKESSILDLCCGQGRHTIELASRGFNNLFGLDRSHYLISKAKTTSKKEGYNITFKEGDARKLSFGTDMFDYVLLAGNSFGYFESVKDDLTVLKEINRVLKPNGKLLIDITDGAFTRENFHPRSWEWIDKNYFVCRERSMSAENDRLISREVITHVNKGVVADQFYAERLYTKEEMIQLLEKTGYGKIDFRTELKTDSNRNQDLGMMERRLIVTSSAQKQWTPIKEKDKNKKHIAVIMGDHRLPDKVKPNQSFDDDDFHTINALKKSLHELADFQFHYLDKHDTLINDLTKSKETYEFIFNLCDEGFNNDATLELHVPALLEMLNIPYSGGTPQCLAYCYDKSLVRGIAQEMDIPVPKAFIVKPEDTVFIELQTDFPVIVKPNFGDSSFGITRSSVCYTIKDLESALQKIRTGFGFEKPVLVEQFLTGKDISVGIIGNPPESYTVLPIIEEDYSALPADLPRICGYEAKWDPNSPYWKLRSIQADLPEETERYLVASCVKLFERLECRDYARFDWRLDANGTPRLLEVNPNPGWCWDGHLAKMAKYTGLSYVQMLQAILEACQSRIQKNKAVLENQVSKAAS